MEQVRFRRNDRGVALLTALALLFFFSMMGAALVYSISIDLERTNVDMRAAHASNFANGGFEAAVGLVAAAIAAGEMPPSLGDPVEIPYVVYRADKSSPAGISPDESVRARATITIIDESGKINLNHASPRVLQAVLGVPGNVARAIRASLPLPDAGPANNRAWLTDVGELLTRGLMEDLAFSQIDPGLVTVYSVADHSNAQAYLNVNAAPPQVLAAALDMPNEAAAALAEKRPFANLQQLSEAAGFNFNGADTADGFGRQLGFESKCFRIVSEGVVAEIGANGAEFRPARRRIEAVVVFDRLAAPEITFWSEGLTADETPAA